MSANTVSFANQSNKWNTASDAAKVVKEIEDAKDMKCLNLEANTLGVEAAEVIGKALSLHPEFEKAYWKDLFTGRLKTEIPVALKHLFNGVIEAGAKLKELDLSDNALGPIGVEGMVEFIKSPSCYSLEILRLNNNGLGSRGGAMLAKALLKLLENSNKTGSPLQLKVFIVGRNKLENDGASSFSQFFSKAGSLEEIQMPQNGIFHQGVAILAEAFSKNPNLKVINLNDNTFTAKGAMSMSQHLPSLENLEIINFGDCLVRTKGASILSGVLKKGFTRLRELHLDGNEIKLEGGLDILEAIKNKSNLEKLVLDCNQFGDGLESEMIPLLEKMEKFDILSAEDNEEPDEDEESDYEVVEGGNDDDDDQYDDVSDEEEELLEYKNNEDDSEENTTDENDPQGIIRKFLMKPSVSMFEKLGKNPARALNEYLEIEASIQEDNLFVDFKDVYLNELTRAVMVLSSIPTDDKIKDKVSRCSNHLVRIACEVTEDMVAGDAKFVNALLVHIGAIKSEDKRFEITWDVKRCIRKLPEILNGSGISSELKALLKTSFDILQPKLNEYKTELSAVQEYLRVQ